MHCICEGNERARVHRGRCVHLKSHLRDLGLSLLLILSACRSRRVLAHATGTQRVLTHKHPGGEGGGPLECLTARAAPQWQNGLSFSVHVSCLTTHVFLCPTWNKQEVNIFNPNGEGDSFEDDPRSAPDASFCRHI